MKRYQYAALPETPDKMVRIYYVSAKLEARQSDESLWNYRQRKWHGMTRKGIARHRAWMDNPQLIQK